MRAHRPPHVVSALLALVLVLLTAPVVPGPAAAAGPVRGFPRAMSWDVGQTAAFSLQGQVSRADITRLGPGGTTAGVLAARLTFAGSPTFVQPACTRPSPTAPSGGDCGRWSVNARWTIPATAPSGLYRLVPYDAAGTPAPDPIWFVVRCDACDADLVYVTADATWQAYNREEGGSLYAGTHVDPATGRPYGQDGKGRLVRVSYDRPLSLPPVDGQLDQSSPLNAEVAMLAYLTEVGFRYKVVSQLDVERDPAVLRRGNRAVVTAGHFEYVSGRQRGAFEAAVAAGVSLLNATGNDFYWKTAMAPSRDGSATPNRTLVCFKETKEDRDTNPSSTWTGTWRDGRFRSTNPDAGRPELTLTGQLWTALAAGGEPTLADRITFTAEQGRSPFLRRTPATRLTAGQSLAMPAGTLGFEWNEVVVDTIPGVGTFAPPANLVALSTTAKADQWHLQPDASGDWSDIRYGRSAATHHVTLYRAASGALVFSAGSVQWSWGLSQASYLAPPGTANRTMQQATLNVLLDMGVRAPSNPGSLGLTVTPPATFAAYRAAAA